MRHPADNGFLNGLVMGMLLSLLAGAVTLYLLTVLDIISVSVLEIPRLQRLLEWCQRNLGLSIIPFGFTLGLYIRSLHLLGQRLDEQRPQDEIAQLEHLSDVWISLFFGIGVIWTAIGMRSALLFALGDPGVTAQAGAYAVLSRLVDGGILTALTTTIVGGGGGYLMRVTKSSRLGTRLNHYYEAQDQRHAVRVEDLLREIRESVDTIGAGAVAAGRGVQCSAARASYAFRRPRVWPATTPMPCRLT